MPVIVTPRSQPPGSVVVGGPEQRPQVTVGYPDAHYAVLPDGGRNIWTRTTDPGALAQVGDIWLAPQ